MCGAIRRRKLGLAVTRLKNIRSTSLAGRRASVGRWIFFGIIDRMHDVGRHDDDQLALVLLEVRGTEQRPQDRQIAKARVFLQDGVAAVLQQAADREASPLPSSIVVSARRTVSAGIRQAVHRDRADIGQFADLGAGP
jgi:hypothetical protein